VGWEDGAKLAVAMLLTVLAGCSSRPSDAVVMEQVRASLTSPGSEAYLVVENFRKTNGYVREDGPYVAEVTYDLVFRKSFREISEETKREMSGNGSALAAFGKGFTLFALGVQYGDFPAGYRVGRTEEVAFRKTEKGWRIVEE
jgi:hypothetical protein